MTSTLPDETSMVKKLVALFAPLASGANLGKMLYGNSGIELPFDDRDMAHLQIVIGAKLRRGVSFFFSWRDDPAGGHHALWIDCAIPLYFDTSTARMAIHSRLIVGGDRSRDWSNWNRAYRRTNSGITSAANLSSES